VAARVMRRYQERLAAYQAVDFDDLIGLPLKLLQRDDEARAKWQAQFRHVLVDEYQDTNAVQYELLKALVRRARASSPRWATTTRASTAGAAPPSTTCGGCRRTTRS
jgi:superfamily I DNA/RNA helicase